MFKQRVFVMFRCGPAIAVLLAVCSNSLAQRVGGVRAGAAPQGPAQTQPNTGGAASGANQAANGVNGFNAASPIILPTGVQTVQPNQFPFAGTRFPLGTQIQATFLPVLGSMTRNSNNPGQANTNGGNGVNTTAPIVLPTGIQTVQPNQFPFAQTSFPLGTQIQATFLPVMGQMTRRSNQNNQGQGNPNQAMNNVIPLNDQSGLLNPFGMSGLGFLGGVGGFTNYADSGMNYLQSAQPTAPQTPPGANFIAPADQAPASVTIRAPYDAEVWVQDQKLNQTGEEYKFLSPILPANRTFTYDVRASWVEDGQKVTSRQFVNVRAGDRKSVLFIEGSSSSSTDRESQSAPQASTENKDANATTARIEMHVPSDAQVWIEGKKMTSAGELRRFVSPPLTAGQNYKYDIRVSWQENGREVSKDRQVSLRAGEHKQLIFSPSSDEKTDR